MPVDLKRISMVTTIAFLVVFGLWYFIWKPHDYNVSFSIPGTRGGVLNKIVEWEDWYFRPTFRTISVIAMKPFDLLTQEVRLGDTTYHLDWKFQRKNMGQVEVEVGIVDTQHSLSHRWQILWRDSQLEEEFVANMKEVGNGLVNYQKTYQTEVIGKDRFQKINYIYTPINTTRVEKANEMIRKNYPLSKYLKENNLALHGYPFVKVNTWDTETDSLHFDFCFPILSTENLVPDVDQQIFPGTIEAIPDAIKAAFYGNYSNSHEAWFELIDYTNENGMESSSQLVEIFYNNPFDGEPEREWRAEVFVFPEKGLKK